MDLTLTEEQGLLVATIRKFVNENVLPLEAKLECDSFEVGSEDLAHLRTRARQTGLYNMNVPKEFGGPGIDNVTRALLTMEMVKHRAGLYAPCYDAFRLVNLSCLFGGTTYQRDQYLTPLINGSRDGYFAVTESGGGSDPANAIATKAVPVGGGFLLSGSKTFISGVRSADFGVVFARSESANHVDEGISCFIVDTDSPGVHVVREIPTLRVGFDPVEIEYDQVFVPEQNLVGDIGNGFQLLDKQLSSERVAYSAACVGVAEKANELAIQYAKDRVVFGKKLSENDGIRWSFVDNEIELRAARLLVLDAAQSIDNNERVRYAAAIAKIAATEASFRVVDRAMQVFGAYGVSKELPFERWFREMRIRRIGEGPTETQRMIVGRELFQSKRK